MKSVKIYLTYQCNLNCDYCFVKPSTKKMSKEMLKKILDWFINQEGDEKRICFYGGEPLLCMDLLSDVRSMANEVNYSNKNIQFSDLPTNGILLNKDYLEILKKQRLELSFSLDGDLATHNTHRTKDSKLFYRILRNIELYKKNYAFPRISLTIHPDQAKNFYKNVLWLFSRGLTRLSISPALGQKWRREEIDAFGSNFSKVISFYFKNKTSGKNNIYIKPIEENVKRIIDKQFLENPTCKLGRELAFSPDGDVFACARVMHLENEEFDKKFKLGHIDEKIDLDKMKSFENYRICSDISLDCRYKFPAISCKKICNCLDFKNKKLLSKEDAESMIEIENMMFLLTYKFLKNSNRLK
ncbi:MAG: radical SAM protein [Nanoarchaeota archaeon]|nr:radical SAM protein [Nanoarchaeota archaeon]MBU4116607.1 radical SAM protein [Nanoarchaeota archaeon]